MDSKTGYLLGSRIVKSCSKYLQFAGVKWGIRVLTVQEDATAVTRAVAEGEPILVVQLYDRHLCPPTKDTTVKCWDLFHLFLIITH